MPVYDCPECGTQLKVRTAPEPGKKIRCPECEEVFVPVSAKVGKKAKEPEVSMAERNRQIEEAGGYGLSGEAHSNKDAEEAAFTPLRDRFERSARGPALIQVVKPSTMLLASGVLTCIMAITGGLYSVWPMIFKMEIVQPEDKMAKWRPPSATGRKFQELTPEQRNERFIWLGGFVFQFLWGTVVCAGASHMHSLSSYPLAMTASIMSIVGPFVPTGVVLLMYALKEDDTMWIPIAILMLALPGLVLAPWCVSLLRKQEVIDGFAAEKPEDY